MSDSQTVPPQEAFIYEGDRFISIQLLPLLLLPGTLKIILTILWICGLSSDEIGVISNLFLIPAIIVSLATLLIVPFFFLTYILYMGTINIVRGHIKKATTFFIVIGLNIFALAPYNIFDAEYLRFLAKKPGYDARVSDLAEKATVDGSKLFVFDFDSQSIIVFDESDEVSRPDRSSEWRARAKAFPVLSEIGVFKHFGGHYYLAYTSVF